MYNLTQFLLRFLISFSLVFSLNDFIVRLHLQRFVFFLRACIDILFLYFIIHLIMTEAQSKRRVLPLVFIVKCFKKPLLIRLLNLCTVSI